jgi:hypothetical protein
MMKLPDHHCVSKLCAPQSPCHSRPNYYDVIYVLKHKCFVLLLAVQVECAAATVQHSVARVRVEQ